MGFAFVIGQCFCCGCIAIFNPVRVPSVRDKEGIKQPLCHDCFHAIQEERKERGLQPWRDHAVDAYEACREEELD